MTEEKKLTGYPSIDKPWLKYYSEETINSKLPEKSIYEYMYDNNKNYPNDKAILYFDKAITYGKMFESIDTCAKAFISIGVKAKDIVTVALPSIPEAIYVIYALNKIGAVANMIHPLAGRTEIKNYLNEVASSVFVAFDKTLEILGDEIRATNVKTTIHVTPVESLGYLKNCIYKLVNKQKCYMDDTINWKTFLRRGKEKIYIEEKCKNINEMAIISHTGGTTGEPKGVCLSDNNINAVLHQICMTLPHNRQEKTLVVLPPFINYSLVNGMLEALAFGFQIILIPDYRPDKIGEYIKQYRPNHINSIPPYLEIMLGCDDLKEEDLSCLTHIVSGGEGLDTEKEKMINKFLLKRGAKYKLAKGLGSTELVCSATFTYDSCNEIGSVGIPLPYMNVKVVEPETFNELAAMQEGEICLTGPSLMLEYYKNKEATDNVIKMHEDGNRWIHMGDLGYMTKDGVLYITGRIKRIMITKGKDGNASKLFPERIEKVIEMLEDVLESCVIGVEDVERVNIPKAYVVKNNNAKDDELKCKILDICKSSLPDYMIPEMIIFIDELPRTARGKVDYREVERMDRENCDYSEAGY